MKIHGGGKLRLRHYPFVCSADISPNRGITPPYDMQKIGIRRGKVSPAGSVALLHTFVCRGLHRRPAPRRLAQFCTIPVARGRTRMSVPTRASEFIWRSVRFFAAAQNDKFTQFYRRAKHFTISHLIFAASFFLHAILLQTVQKQKRLTKSAV